MDPGEGWPPVTGVISPLSTSTTVLIVFRTEEAVFQSPSFPTAVAQGTHDTTSLFSDVVDDILNQVDHSLVDPAPSGKLKSSKVASIVWVVCNFLQHQNLFFHHALIEAQCYWTYKIKLLQFKCKRC